jgi:hypothetical protein
MKKITTLLFLISLTISNLFGLLVYDPYYGIFDNSGSALCENLKLKYTLPDSLKTGYSYTVDVKKNLDKRELSITYKFLPSKTSVFTTEIVSDFTDYFLPISEITQEERFWTYLINVDVSGKITSTNKSFDPNAVCEEITHTCDEVRYVQKSIRYKNDCGSSGKGYNLYPVVSNDSLIIISETVPVTMVCVSKTFGIDSDVVVFKGLKDLNYKVFRQARYFYFEYTIPYNTSSEIKDTVYTIDTSSSSIEINYLPIVGIPAFRYYLFVGNADLSSCIGVGLEDAKTKLYDLYPNPVSSELNISNFEGQIKLTNQVGSQFVIDGNQSFDVSDLPKGLYIVHFELNGQVQQEKVIIK